MVRIERLDDRFSGDFTPPRAPGDLRQKLEGSLGRPEVREPQAHVRADDPDEGDARKVVPLCDHLRADQHVELAPRESREQFGDGATAADRVAVHASDTGARKMLSNLLFDPLRPESELFEIRPRAFRADL